MERLLTFDGKGIYCPAADVHIDPWKKVPKALITHAHADHARRGMGSYIATKETVPILQLRLGKNIDVYGVDYGETILINGVKFSFHPAGHVIGSAQIRVEYKGEIWVVSGDYKTKNDGISGQFHPVKCHSFITESTFGLPVYNWQKQELIFDKINRWWNENKANGQVSVLTAYSLGKAQRIIQNVDHSIGKIYTHGSIENTNKAFRQNGVKLKETTFAAANIPFDDYQGSLVIAPGNAATGTWGKKFKDFRLGSASGWLNVRSARKRRPVDIGFVLSDHADWKQLNEAVEATGAEEIFVTHGFSDIYAQFLREKGYDAKVVKTAFEGERQEAAKEESAV